MTERDENKRAPQDAISEELDFEPEEELGTLGAAKAKMQKLRVELAKVKAERQEFLDGWQRCKANTINARRDALAEAERSAQRNKESFIEELIPVLDSFDMAAQSEQWGSIDSGFRTGMENVRNQLLDTLSRHGIIRFGAVGDAYSPYTHDAIEERDDMPGESGTIARILRFGYKSGDKIIRPAQVIIKK